MVGFRTFLQGYSNTFERNNKKFKAIFLQVEFRCQKNKHNWKGTANRHL